MAWRWVLVFIVLGIVVASVCCYLVLRRSRSGGSKTVCGAILYDNLHGPPEGFDGGVKVLKELRPWMVWYSKAIVGFSPVPNASSAYVLGLRVGLFPSKAKLFAK